MEVNVLTLDVFRFRDFDQKASVRRENCLGEGWGDD